ncbi:hypothetical protein [uncultured Rubinisphaera sp.]|uniref:hypothetical protein n=1 Tax=uncultured Rubinisphaera sp. TaxID=1678686 RepID=UPI0030DB847F
MARKATIKRKTGETDIELTLDIDGSGNVEIETGVGFLDHMLTVSARRFIRRLAISRESPVMVQ